MAETETAEKVQQVVLIPAALTTSLDVEIDDMAEFYMVARAYSQFYGERAADNAARADALEQYPGHEDRVAVYRGRAALAKARQAAVDEWQEKIGACLGTLVSLRS